VTRWDRLFPVACACCKADGANVPEVEAVIVLLLSLVRDAFSTALMASLLAPGTAFPPLSAEALATVQQAASSLLQAAAARNNLPLPADFSAQAAQQLQLQLQNLVTRTSAEALPALAAPGALATPETLRAELEAALDAEQALKPLVDAWSYQTYNAGTVRAAATNGENFVQLVAKLDNKTTKFCQLVNGRVIPMARALAQLDRIAAATAAGDVEALIAATPFHPNPSEATQEEVDAILAEGGLAPFHFRCRTQNVPVRIGS